MLPFTADTARLIARNAYSPYSGYKVGAAALFENAAGTLFYGTNVENASYGLTICAERAAIFTGVSAGFRRLKAIAISTLDRDNKPIACFSPCGACLQVIAEFADDTTDIVLDGCGCYKLRDLLPRAFTLVPAAKRE